METHNEASLRLEKPPRTLVKIIERNVFLNISREMLDSKRLKKIEVKDKDRCGFDDWIDGFSI